MNLTADQKLTAQRITNFFENGDLKFHYSYIEDLKDGRGYTAGFFGCCSGTGDMLAVVERYCRMTKIVNPENRLRYCLPELRHLAEKSSDDVSVLNEDGFDFEKVWKDAANDPLFRKAQHEVCDELYWEPSQKYAAKLGVKSAIGAAILYDTIIQHGDGTDEDSLKALIDRVPFRVNGVNEETWLAAFLKVRHDDLVSPYDHSTQKVWAASAGRVTALNKLLDSGNMILAKPFQIRCFGSIARFEP